MVQPLPTRRCHTETLLFRRLLSDAQVYILPYHEVRERPVVSTQRHEEAAEGEVGGSGGLAGERVAWGGRRGAYVWLSPFLDSSNL